MIKHYTLKVFGFQWFTQWILGIPAGEPGGRNPLKIAQQ